MNEPVYSEITPARLPERLQPLAEEICTYFRELPRLLEEGKEGKFALIRGSELVSVWDTFDDALHAGYGQFGIDRFMAQAIKKRDLHHLADLFVQEKERVSA